METRLIFFKKRRLKKTMKVTGLLTVLVFLTLSLTTIRMLPGTFAYFTSETQATGTIHNASSADLITVNTGKIVYEKNCKIKSSISITNKSTIKIPITVELLTKNGGNHSSSTTLEPNATFSTNPNDVDNLPNRREIQNIQYRIIGFNGYIDEIYTLPVDQQRLEASKDKNNAKEVTPTKSQEIIEKAEPQNPVVDQIDGLPNTEGTPNTSGDEVPPSSDKGDQVTP